MITHEELMDGLEYVDNGREFTMHHTIIGTITMSHSLDEIMVDLGEMGVIWCDDMDVIQDELVFWKGPDTVVKLNAKFIEVIH